MPELITLELCDETYDYKCIKNINNINSVNK